MMDPIGWMAIRQNGMFHRKSQSLSEVKDFMRVVPSTYDAYDEWLMKERDQLTRKTEALKNKFFIFTKAQIESFRGGKDILELAMDDRDRCGHFYTHHPRRFLCMDGEDIPDWVFIMDLDQELFIIDRSWSNSRHRAAFELQDLPHDRWHQACLANGFDYQLCPEAHPWSGVDFIPNMPLYESSYDLSGVCLPVISVKPLTGDMGMRHIVGLMVFDKMADSYVRHWWKQVPDGGLVFAFHEVAFAILSLASGQFYLENIHDFYHHNNNQDSGTFYFDITNTQEPRLIPNFGTEFFIEGSHPGCAPYGRRIYWFNGCLISLASDHRLRSDMALLLKEAIEHGVNAGHSSFMLIIFSVRRAVFIEVADTKNVSSIRISEPIVIYSSYQSFGPHPRGRHPECTNLAQMCNRHAGFRIMQTFFEKAVNRQRSQARDTLPVEIYSNIVQHLDLSTLNTCESVSPAIYNLRKPQVRFSHGLNITKFEAHDSVPAYVRDGHASMGMATFMDKRTGRVVETQFGLKPKLPNLEWFGTTAWCPVIGSWSRSSIMVQLQLYTREDLGAVRRSTKEPLGSGVASETRDHDNQVTN